MFRLKITAPVDRILKLVIVRSKQLNGFRIGHMAEIGGHNMIQPLQKTLVNKLVEKRHFFGSVFKDIGDDILNHVLCQAHIIRKIGKGDFRLDHPELCRMAGCIGVFGAEGRTEGVDVAECHGVGFAVQLAGNGQVGGLVKEVLAVINFAVLCQGRICHIQRGNLEHFAGTLTVGAGNQRRMNIDKAAFLEKLMNGESSQRTNAENSLERVGARTKMRQGAKVFQCMTFGLNREVRRGRAFDHNAAGLNFKRLLCVRRYLQRTGNNQCSADIDFGDFGKVFHGIGNNNLHRLEKRAV